MSHSSLGKLSGDFAALGPGKGSWVASSTSLAVCRHLPKSRCSQSFIQPCLTSPSPCGVGPAAAFTLSCPTEGPEGTQHHQRFPGMDQGCRKGRPGVTRAGITHGCGCAWFCVAHTTLISQVRIQSPPEWFNGSN